MSGESSHVAGGSTEPTAFGGAGLPGWYWLADLTGGFGLALNAMMNFLLPLRAAELGIGIGVIGLVIGVKAGGLAFGLRAGVNQAASAAGPPIVAGVIGATAATVGFPIAGLVGAGFLLAALITGRSPAVGGGDPD